MTLLTLKDFFKAFIEADFIPIFFEIWFVFPPGINIKNGRV